MAGLFFALSAGHAAAQTAGPLILHSDDGLTIRAHIQAGLNGVAEQNLFWNLADIVAPASGYHSDTQWLEGYIKPGLSFAQEAGSAALYGKISAVGSFTLGTDAYDMGDTGRIGLEEGYLGLKTELGDESSIDISIGPRELRLGTGMLISNGASNGFERGALKFGPRKAWEMAAIGSLDVSGFGFTSFYIEPNELPSNDSDNRLAGADLRYDSQKGDFIGATYIHVLESDSPYPKAAPGGIGPPTVIPGAREGLNAISTYGRIQPFDGELRNLFFAGDFAYEWNERIDMSAWAGRLQAGYTFSDVTWTPTLTLSYQTFSGDDPNTATLERFDPLYYDGSPAAWATGSKSAMTFINSNAQSFNVALRLAPTQRDAITFRYAHVRANELLSPIQFGQATRVNIASGVDNIVSGVTNAHLSDDFFIEYSRIINPNTYLTAGFSISVPGKGIRDVFPGSDPIWSGGFVNVVVNY